MTTLLENEKVHPRCDCHQCTWLRANQLERATIPQPQRPPSGCEHKAFNIYDEVVRVCAFCGAYLGLMSTAKEKPAEKCCYRNCKGSCILSSGMPSPQSERSEQTPPEPRGEFGDRIEAEIEKLNFIVQDCGAKHLDIKEHLRQILRLSRDGKEKGL